ncbi:MAG TPA: glycoside hydrolase family 2 TIM barrel-domain containing protein [Candidatus Methylacidiphilales bacterium]|nr:glycoside hydrolase family 2 TIM barrel-domain containing protein [Candidatus Methylacidiphilales bacterium]
MPLRFLRFLSVLGFLVALAGAVRADDARVRQRLDDNWKFFLGDPPQAAAPDFDDASWRSVTLPHDWSIEGHIGPKEPTGGGGGFFPTGIGWYRLKLDVPPAWAGRQVQLEFEGVYMLSEVYLNGKKVAAHPYGYTGFFADLTASLLPGQTNVIAVRVDNSRQKNTRWYSGSGIYRHVWLQVTGPVHVANWGVFASTRKAGPPSATLAVATTVQNDSPADQRVIVETEVQGPRGAALAKSEDAVSVPAHQTATLTPELVMANPPLWFPETPQLCTVRTRVKSGGQVVDEVNTVTGLRFLAWSADAGLTINGRTYKLKGGCIHHDNGVLGACAFDRAEERKIELLKAAGFTAIRTAHNPPSPALLNACDRLGMLVMEEAFDCWTKGKNRNDYSVDFSQWWQRDLDAMVERDRNHPSVVLWSIGNEIPGIYSQEVGPLGPQLTAHIHALDTTRPVTNGILGWPKGSPAPDAAEMNMAEANWSALDIVGSNYALGRHIAEHAQHPARVLVSTESYPPVGMADASLGNAFVAGDFVWSAQDYLGECGVGRWFYKGDPTEPLNPPRPAVAGQPAPEPSPVGHGSDSLYPWHGANSGELDLLGNRKPASHRWNVSWDAGEKLYLAVRQPERDKPIVVVGWGWFPTWDSWTWPGEEGKPMHVEVYSRYPKVRLYLNDKLVGEQDVKSRYETDFTLPYEPGTLKAAGVVDGKEVESYALKTTGEPSALRLLPDRKVIQADGQDLSFVQVEVVDRDGNLQPNADEKVHFILSGPGTIAGLGNALLKGEAPYQGSDCRIFHGRALVVLRGTRTPGSLKLQAEAKGLASADAEVATQ